MLHSWRDHLRQNERVTEGDRKLQEAIRETLVSGTQPLMTHYVTDPSV